MLTTTVWCGKQRERRVHCERSVPRALPVLGTGATRSVGRQLPGNIGSKGSNGKASGTLAWTECLGGLRNECTVLELVEFTG